jgi:glycosyltransferase involved in cell wall biosynthesis
LTPEKGVYLFAEACRRAGVRPVYVGDGECCAQLERKFPEAVCTGWRAEAEVREIMMTARAVVLPSLWYETQGLVVLEAAAIGIPAIVAETSAARDYVIDGATGLWFKGGNAEDLTSKISLLKDSAAAHRMGRSAYDRFWSNPPTMERHVEGLERAYACMLHSSRMIGVQIS